MEKWKRVFFFFFFHILLSIFIHDVHSAYIEVLPVGHNARYGTALCALSAISLLVHDTRMHSGWLCGILQSCHL